MKRKYLFLLSLFLLVGCTNKKANSSISSSLEDSNSILSSNNSSLIESTNEDSLDNSSNSSFESSLEESSSSNSKNIKEEKLEEYNLYYSSINLENYGPNGKKSIKNECDKYLNKINSLSNEELLSLNIDSLKNTINNIPTLNNSLTNNIFISEIFNIGYDKDTNPTGNNQNKAIELYNPFDHDISLTNYHIEIYSNGIDYIKNQDYKITFSEDKIIKANECFLIVNEYAEELLKDKASLVTKNFLGSKSTFALFYNDQLVDCFGIIGTYFSTNGEDYIINDTPYALNNHNVIRNKNYGSDFEFNSSKWNVNFDYDFSTLGVHNYND